MKTPLSYSFWDYAGVVLIAVWGGAVRLVKRRTTLTWELVIVKFVTSGFVGIITFWICEAYGVDSLITGATVGIAGHMGGDAITITERLLVTKINRLSNERADTQKDH